jgi:hypothetical protein
MINKPIFKDKTTKKNFMVYFKYLYITCGCSYSSSINMSINGAFPLNADLEKGIAIERMKKVVSKNESRYYRQDVPICLFDGSIIDLQAAENEFYD